eukprot:scaffold1121_cov317-Prasinococcus_capsulatus_cf.AAC.3
MAVAAAACPAVERTWHDAWPRWLQHPRAVQRPRLSCEVAAALPSELSPARSVRNRRASPPPWRARITGRPRSAGARAMHEALRRTLARLNPIAFRSDIAAQFPAITGTEWALLENAGGSQVPECVIDAVARHMRTCYVQLGPCQGARGPADRAGRAPHSAAVLANERGDGRACCRRWLRAVGAVDVQRGRGPPRGGGPVQRGGGGRGGDGRELLRAAAGAGAGARQERRVDGGRPARGCRERPRGQRGLLGGGCAALRRGDCNAPRAVARAAVAVVAPLSAAAVGGAPRVGDASKPGAHPPRADAPSRMTRTGLLTSGGDGGGCGCGCGCARAPGDCLTASLENLRAVLSERTKLVAVPHVSNLVGEVVDLRAVTEMAHGVGAQVVVDGVAFAPHRAMDVRAWEVDWYVFSVYKVYGPHVAALFGTSAAWARVAAALPNHFFVPESDRAYKFELGGVCHEACAGVVAIGDYLRPSTACARWRRRSRSASSRASPTSPRCARRAARALGAAQRPELNCTRGSRLARQVRVLQSAGDGDGDGDQGAERRVPTVSFVHEARRSEEVVAALHARKLAVRHGHMYSLRLVRALAHAPASPVRFHDLEDGVVRVSALHYNTPAQVDAVLDCLRAL